MITNRVKITVLFMALTATACGVHEQATQSPDRNNLDTKVGTDFDLVSTQILNEKCTSCHNSTRAAAGVDLGSFSALQRGRAPDGRALIDFSNPMESVLIAVVASGRMPPREPLEPDSIELLKCWLNAGANEESIICANLRALPAPEIPIGPTASPSPTASISPVPDPIEIPASPSPSPMPLGPDFAHVYEQVIEPYCVGCHAGEFAAKGVDLSTFEAIISASAVLGGENETGIAIPLVVPEKPEESVLWLSIKNDRMPYYSRPLTEKDKNLVREWIASGARP